MYTITSSVFIHFGHHVRGHDGPCISLHGHTWKFEISVAAEELDAQQDLHTDAMTFGHDSRCYFPLCFLI